MTMCLESPDSQPIADVYERLSVATPEQRRSLVLALIAQHPDNLLELPREGGKGASLNGIDLRDDETMATVPSNAAPMSANVGRPVISLAGAVLPGAVFELANLKGLNLSSANLSGTNLRRAKLSHANLEQSNMEDADLAGAQLQQAAIGKANLCRGKLEEADLQSATMRFCQLQSAVLEDVNLSAADLWGADLRDAVLRGANLRGAVFNEADLCAADVSEADCANASFVRAKLSGADFTNSDLRGAELRGADLRDAILSGARLSGVDLSDCDIRHACFAGAVLDRTQMNVEQLAGATGEELFGNYDAARKSYLALERNFRSLSDADGASWAYRKRRRMQKKAALEKSNAAFKSRRITRGLRSLARYVSDQTVEYACDYGESILRVFASLLVVYVLFIVIYGITGSVTRIEETPHGSIKVVTRDLTDLAIFSLLAMTTSGSPTVVLQPSHELVHLISGIQALLGIALTGLLGFVIGNRIRR